MNKRRAFIKDLLVGGIGIGLLSAHRFTDEPPKIGWNQLRSFFTFPMDYHYMNSGGAGLSPIHVTHAYKQAIDEMNSTGRYSKYKKELQQRLAEFVKCEPSELALTGNVTEGINVAVWSIPLKEGDEVIVCNEEHAGNAIPWLNRAQRDKLVIKVAKVGKTNSETIANIAALVSARTKVFALPHISCISGNILPIRQIVAMAKASGAYTLIDGAHGPGMIELELKDMGVDFYASCFHKWMLGPKSMGWLYIDRNRLSGMQHTYVGAHSDNGWSLKDGEVEFKGIIPDDALRYTYGTQSMPQFAAGIATIDFLDTLNMGKVAKHIRKLGASFCEQLLDNPQIQVHTSIKRGESAGIISFSARNMDSDTLLAELSKARYRLRAVKESGNDHIRACLHIYNTQAEVDALASLIKQLTDAH